MFAIGFGGVMKSLDWIGPHSIFPESALVFYLGGEPACLIEGVCDDSTNSK